MFWPRRRRGTRSLLLCAVFTSAVVAFISDAFYGVYLAQVTGCSSGPDSRATGEGHKHNIVDTPKVKGTLFVEPFHGLGNRLRAYASAAALAKKSGRSLVVVWVPDVHIGANFTDLFQVPSGVTVVHFPILFYLMQNHDNLLVYDYNSKGGKDKILRDRSCSAIYVRSAYVLQSETKVVEADIVEELKALMPVPSVTRRATKGSAHLAGLKNIIGVHIRMQTDIEMDVPGISKLPAYHAAGISSMGPVESYRSRCHYSEFIPRFEEALVANRESVFLVATDSDEAVDALRTKYGRRVLTFQGEPTNCSGILARGRSCVQEALAQFLALSNLSTSLMLSDWSSASELIRRLGSPTPYITGCAKEENHRCLPLSLACTLHRMKMTNWY